VTSTPVATVSAPAARPSVRRGLALLPVGLWAAILVVMPNLLLVVYSLWRSEDGKLVQTITFQNYLDIIGSNVSLLLLARTLLTGLGAALLATFIAYPMAFFVVRRLHRRRLLAVMLVIVPLWISYLVRVYAWKLILGDSGVINTGLEAAGLITKPLTFLLYSRLAVFIVLTYVSIPFVFLASYTALERIPAPLYEAGADCGASPFRVMRTIVWPLSRQGAMIGFSLALLMCMGDYLTPTLVGGMEGTMFGNLIVSEFGLANNWPRGAALSITLLVVVGLLLAAVARLTRTEAVIE
jgi:spermidine/putrescine transport system permease protein